MGKKVAGYKGGKVGGGYGKIEESSRWGEEIDRECGTFPRVQQKAGGKKEDCKKGGRAGAGRWINVKNL